MKITHRLIPNGNLNQDLIFFEDLFLTYHSSLLAFAYKYVNDKQVAEDIVQDVFMALWARKHKLDFSESIKPYLYKATLNKSLTYLNSIHEEKSIDDKDIEYALHQKIVSYNQQDSLLLKEITQEIRFFVNTLPPQCKKVFQLSREDNLKNKEIAEKLKISEKTVEGHIRKALFELRNHLIKLNLMDIIVCLYVCDTLFTVF
ncbi:MULTISPECIES: RNA polymerase sigma-70 factor [Bacteroides]|uniref:RNA polymerase sigma-70 factor n=1 Tax=Bacteroides TaxID=816 RepID=UPI0004BBAF9F|nr:RNA polymerase sigma-70 factor [Bacteroides neonati]